MRTDVSIEERARFDFIRYANLWEDANILCEALNAGPEKRFLSISSGGDNAFALIAEGAEVVAVDLNSAQIACTELKTAAIKNLSRDEVLQFFGVEPAAHRLQTFQHLKDHLSPSSRLFWNNNLASLDSGFIHSGKFERYFQTFRKRILPLIATKSKVDRLLRPMSRSERREFYQKEWNTWRWRLLFKVFFSRAVMGRGGRDPEFFRYVKGSVGARILERATYGLTELPNHENPYLHYILRGNYLPALPRYLRPEVFPQVKAGLSRLTIQQGTVEEIALQYGQNSFDGYNLSDIFEYLDENLSLRIYKSLLECARPKARFVYWNMLVPRRVPVSLADKVTPLHALAKELFERDLAFFYSAFHIEEVLSLR